VPAVFRRTAALNACKYETNKNTLNTTIINLLPLVPVSSRKFLCITALALPLIERETASKQNKQLLVTKAMPDSVKRVSQWLTARYWLHGFRPSCFPTLYSLNVLTVNSALDWLFKSQREFTIKKHWKMALHPFACVIAWLFLWAHICGGCYVTSHW